MAVSAYNLLRLIEEAPSIPRLRAVRIFNRADFEAVEKLSWKDNVMLRDAYLSRLAVLSGKPWYENLT